MSKGITYTTEQVDYIKRVLARREGTIEALIWSLSLCSDDTAKIGLENTKKNCSDEIATCIRILDTEGQYI